MSSDLSPITVWRMQLAADTYWLGYPALHVRWQQFAHLAVMREIKAGAIPKARESGLACVDCGAPAQCWEHRDYTQPLRVDPCCHSCNCKRGAAFSPNHAPDPTPRQRNNALCRLRYDARAFGERMKAQRRKEQRKRIA